MSNTADQVQQQEEQEKKLIFEENERVLCYHGPLIYEAKVRENDLSLNNNRLNTKK